MKPILIKFSIYLNIILLFTVLDLIYALGIFNKASLTSSLPLTASQSPKAVLAAQLPTDNLASDSNWQKQVKHQVTLSRGQEYSICVFGDSISQPLRNSLGQHTFNFALGGMSTVSIVEQLKILTPANIKCNQVIIAMGTNDAWYRISDDSFVKNLTETVTLVHKMAAQKIFFIPAFYATLAASHDPNVAGTNERIDELNKLIQKVGAEEQVFVAKDSLQELFNNHALKENLTYDGVHLNEDGLTIYRLALLEILHPKC